MHATLPLLAPSNFPRITRRRVETVQVNLGYRCNQTCLHCHVNAGPQRKESMRRETIDQVLGFLDATGATTLDVTGGAPELNPDFRYLVRSARDAGVRVIDRCNLTILLEPDQEDLAGFLAMHRVEITASLPCYLEDNVDSQRGKGVYESSIRALQQLNALGYGTEPELPLNLVYNPLGPRLPPDQTSLEADYRRELGSRFGIAFTRLYTLANMPIQRFGSTLVTQGRFGEYMRLLRDAHRDENLEQVMCRTLVSVDWEGYLYDCDFNQMLGIPLVLAGRPRRHVSEVTIGQLSDGDIAVADHCYGCTAGQGSSCGGALEA